LNAFLDVSKKLSCSVCNHSEEFTSSKPVISDSHTTVPDADDNHDVSYVHLLEDGQQLVTATILTVVVKSLSKDFLLLYRVHLADSIG